jgi:signal transduction histidine kinase
MNDSDRNKIMTLFSKKTGYRGWLTKWYIGFFTIVVIGFTSVIYLHISNQTWEKFNFAVSQLGEEMLEELMELRDDLDDEEFDSTFLTLFPEGGYDLDDFGPIKWTPDLLAQFKSGIEQEIIDESIDNHISDIGFVQISNLISGQIIYQSPGIAKYKIIFMEPENKHWGYRRFEFKTSGNVLLKGMGYSGVRITKNYFVGLVLESSELWQDKHFSLQMSLTIYNIAEAIDRQADSLYVEDKNKLVKMIKELNAWAYIYIYEEDRLLWSTKDVSKSDIYIPYHDYDSDIIVTPREILPKEYFYDIHDDLDRDYRQYTLIYDIIPTYLYKMDLAVPTESIKDDLKFIALIFTLGALILIGIVWAGGFILMRRALQPVDEIIRSVNEITSTNLDKRLPIPKLENEIMRLVRTFNELLDRLAKSFRMQKTFIADASHELRTPLSIMLSDIETALKNLENPAKTKETLNNSVLEIERMARIVDDLHLLARNDLGQINVNKKDIRLDDVLMATVSRCQVLASKKKIKIEINRIDIIEYYGDEELLIRAFSNLIYNAIKYSDENAKVELNLYKKESLAYFSVIDQGLGIPEKDVAKIFDRFYRVDSSRSRETGGSGLGLSIAKWICEIHSGTIKVFSKMGKGSTFTIELPIKMVKTN